MLKRSFDLLAALIGICALAPVIGLGVLAVRLTSPGPGIFSQRRVGRNGKIFYCHKLRTMHVETPEVPSHEGSVSFVTPLGHFLRRTKLDELPQLYNVLRGEMSFVGPRPCLPTQTELVRERDKYGLFALRPGITGLAQIRGIDMSDPKRLAMVDAEYAKSASLAVDLRILWVTVFRGAGRGDRVRG